MMLITILIMMSILDNDDNDYNDTDNDNDNNDNNDNNDDNDNDNETDHNTPSLLLSSLLFLLEVLNVLVQPALQQNNDDNCSEDPLTKQW